MRKQFMVSENPIIVLKMIEYFIADVHFTQSIFHRPDLL
jgi:hypothetical protein